MGETRSKMMSKTLVLVLAAFVVLACGIEEIQELGNDDDATGAKSVAKPEAEDELGEGVGGRGASLSTTGSFTLSSGCNSMGNSEEDELGEGVGGRGAFLSTTGSFTLSSGGNSMGNSEEDELGEGVGGRGAFLSTTGSFTLSSG